MARLDQSKGNPSESRGEDKMLVLDRTNTENVNNITRNCFLWNSQGKRNRGSLKKTQKRIRDRDE